MSQDTALAYGVTLNAAQRRKAAEAATRALDAIPEPNPREDVDKWLWWVKGRFQYYGKSRGVNVFVCNRYFKEIEQWARDTDDVVANCQWRRWFVLFCWKIDRSIANQKQMLRQFEIDKIKRETDKTFHPSFMSDRLKTYLMKSYGLEEHVVHSIFIQVVRFAEKAPMADPRTFISNVIMQAENLKFNADGQHGKHWFASPQSNLPFLVPIMELCFKRGVELEDRLPLINRALGGLNTPFEYAGKPVEALKAVQALIDAEHPALTGYYVDVGGFVPDSEAAALIPFPNKGLTAKEEADAAFGPKKETNMATGWTKTDKNGPFWGEAGKLLKHLGYNERVKFIHKVVKDKWNLDSLEATEDPTAVIMAIKDALLPNDTPNTAVNTDSDELVDAPPKKSESKAAKPAPKVEPPADDLPASLDGVTADDEEIPSLVPGKNISSYLHSLKTLTGVEAVEIAYWLNRPYGRGVNDPDYYKPVTGPGGAKWTDLDPVAIRRRLCKVFGPQGIGWKIVADEGAETYTEAAKKGTLDATRCVMTNYLFKYAVINGDNKIEWMEVGGLGASNVNADHKYAMHGANTSLLKRAMALLGGYDHFVSGEE